MLPRPAAVPPAEKAPQNSAQVKAYLYCTPRERLPGVRRRSAAASGQRAEGNVRA